MDWIFKTAPITTIVLFVMGCNADQSDTAFEKALGVPHDLSLEASQNTSSKEPIRALPLTLNYDKDIAELGKKLFNDTRLSSDNTISCASCHLFSEGGDDNHAVPTGINGIQGKLNTPTVLNATFNLAQFWDGRAITLQEQAPQPIHDPAEMASNWAEIIPKLSADQDYVQKFERLYSEGISGENIAHAIAEFERSLVTPSAFDRYLRGDDNAISSQAKQGFQLFKAYGCVSCHQGMNVGGNMFQKFGALMAFYEDKAQVSDNAGISNADPSDEESNVFKVPSLRNAALTAPYFHNASAHTLSDAITIMAQIQLGETLSTEEINLIKEFIISLNGEVLNF